MVLLCWGRPDEEAWRSEGQREKSRVQRHHQGSAIATSIVSAMALSLCLGLNQPQRVPGDKGNDREEQGCEQTEHE